MDQRGPRITAEEIVREYRQEQRPLIETMRCREHKRTPGEIGERIIKIFLLLVIGWGLGYLHHFFATTVMP